MKKVLILEDNDEFQSMWQYGLVGKVEIYSATTVEEGKALFQENRDFDLIVVDACVPGNRPTTHHFVKSIRENYGGPILATSCVQDFANLLMSFGCSHKSEKYDVPQKVIEILGL